MTKRKWVSLGIAIVALIGIAIYFVGFYPTPSERAFDKGLTYVKEQNVSILQIHKKKEHGPSVFFFEDTDHIGMIEAASGEDLIQAKAQKNNVTEGISLVSLAGIERHSGILLEREDAADIEHVTFEKDDEELAQFEIEEDDGNYSGFLDESQSLSDFNVITLTKANGETEVIIND
ncbi:hypothetical protein ACI2JA_07470 [Alkalihalobacillus sp. NPDC078783]